MKKMLSLILAGALSLSLTVPALAAGSSFTDVPTTHWAYSAIEEAANKGWVSGVGGGKFAPGGTLTNAQFMVMAVRANFPSEAKGLTPKSGEEWWEPYMDLSEANGFLEYTGIQNNSTSANKPISREVMAQVITNTATYNMLETEIHPEEMDVVKASVKDWGKVEWEHQTAVGYCYNKGILSGKSGGMFAPDDTLTRAEAAVVLTRAEAAFELVLGENWRGDSDYVQTVNPSSPAGEGQNKPANPGEVFNPNPSESKMPTFAMLNGENVQKMMDRINKATPAYREGYLTNGKKITEANIQAMLEQMAKDMPEGSPWTGFNAGDTYRYVSPKFGGGSGCNSFGAAVSDMLFGEDAPMVKHQNFDQIKVGDVIWEKTATTGGHVVVVTSMPDADGYYYTCDGNNGDEVSWDSWNNINYLINNPDRVAASYVYSRY